MAMKLANGVFIETPFADEGDRETLALLASINVTTQAGWEMWVDAATQAQLNGALRKMLKMFVTFKGGPTV